MTLQEKFEAEWALFKLKIKQDDPNLHEYIKNAKPIEKHIVVTFFNEEYFEFKLTNNIRMKVPTQIFKKFNQEIPTGTINRNY